ncbi:MAG: pirin family protein [Marmoricola sp.]|nr:pirin family protein [Marmoricola sp.]
MIEYRGPEERFVTLAEGRKTYHSFSFGPHYDPANVGFASLVAFNDERLPQGTGYDDHPHGDVEIVTWVLSGVLRHTSGVGSGVVGPGQVQRLSAGSGVVHSEVSDSDAETRFLQAWVRPDSPGTPPDYRAADVPTSDGWSVVAGAGGAVPIGTAGAALLVARPPAGHRLTLPDSPRLHVFVAAGTAMLGERLLEPGDAARLLDEGGRPLTVETDAELVVWSFAAYGM